PHRIGISYMSTKQISNAEKQLNRILTWIAWLFITIAVIVLAWFYLFSRHHASTNDAQVKQYITPIASKVSGYIDEIRFEENQFVKKGDTLIVIDNRELKQDIDMAAADLAAIQNSVISQTKMVATRMSDTHVITANIEAAKVEVWRTQQDYYRFKNLVEQESATRQQFESAEAKYKQAKATLEAMEQQNNSVKIGVEAEEAKIAPVQSQVQNRTASLQKANLKYSFSYIVAPYDGWVGTKSIQEGQLIKEGQALVQVVSKEKWIVANFKETQLAEIELNSEVEVKVDAYSGIHFKGKVLSFSPASGSEFALIKPNNATGNFVKIEQRFPVKISLPNTADLDKLRSGMNVEVAVKSRK
uniref:HlyD family secretion protein n=1 Tax=Pedobacter sp. TaxID=1411316 RepID=UPI003D7F6F3D